MKSRTAPISEEEAAALRSAMRKRVLWAAKLVSGAKRYDCVVVDLSLGGARIRLTEPMMQGEPVTLMLDQLGALRAEVAWHEEQSVGLRFVEDEKTIAKSIGARLSLATTTPTAKSA